MLIVLAVGMPVSLLFSQEMTPMKANAAFACTYEVSEEGHNLQSLTVDRDRALFQAIRNTVTLDSSKGGVSGEPLLLESLPLICVRQ